MSARQTAGLTCAVVSTGALTFLAHPGVGLSVAAPVALVPLLLATARATPTRAALAAWGAGTLAWLLALQWLPAAAQGYTGCSEVVGFALFALAAIAQGVVFGLAALAARWGERRGSAPRWLAWPLGFATAEALTPQLIPYSLGAGLSQAPSLQQAAALAGMPAVTLLLVLFQVLLADAFSPRRAKRALVAATALALLVAGGGRWRQHLRDEASATSPSIRIGMIQVGMDAESARRDPGAELRRYAELSTELLGKEDVDILVWAEGAISRPLHAATIARDLARQLCAGSGCEQLLPQALVLGAAIQTTDSSSRPAALSNSVLLQRGGEVCAECRYDKQRLVPFMEGLPFGATQALAKWFPSASPYATLAAPRPLATPWGHLVTTICYEGLFPDASEQLSDPKTNRLLLNLSSDAWLPGEMARRAHFHLVALRAIEQDKFLVRVATDGISAVVTPSGQVVAALSGRDAGVLVWPVTLNERVSIYSRGGKWTWWGVALIVLLSQTIRTISGRSGRNLLGLADR